MADRKTQGRIAEKIKDDEEACPQEKKGGETLSRTLRRTKGDREDDEQDLAHNE